MMRRSGLALRTSWAIAAPRGPDRLQHMQPPASSLTTTLPLPWLLSEAAAGVPCTIHSQCRKVSDWSDSAGEV